MMSKLIQYMVKFNLPENITEDFFELVPKQRLLVAEMFSDGRLASFTLSLEYGKLWAVFNATGIKEVVDIINIFPLTRYMEYKIYPLSFHQTMENSSMTFSLN